MTSDDPSDPSPLAAPAVAVPAVVVPAVVVSAVVVPAVVVPAAALDGAALAAPPPSRRALAPLGRGVVASSLIEAAARAASIR